VKGPAYRAFIADFRKRLCEVATDIYIEKGLEGLNMRELAALHGVATLYLSGAVTEDEFEATRTEIMRVLTGAYRQ
jgi:hypothetical protein